MPVTRRKEDSLVETSVLTKDKVLSDVKPAEIKDTTSGGDDKKDAKSAKATKKVKKSGPIRRFIGSTFAELRKVEWPKFGYVGYWMVVVIVFTAIMSMSLGFFDHTFTAGMKFVSCSAGEARKPVDQCGRNLVDDLTFRQTS